MKHLLKAIEAEKKGRLTEFIERINQEQESEGLNAWYYSDLIPRGKNIKNMSFADLKAYLIKRKESEIYKSIEREADKVKAVLSSGELQSLKISIEWKRSKMWGSNPKAECWYTVKNEDGSIRTGYVSTGSIGGCGYDKQSTAVADCLNQINAVLKPLYSRKDRYMAKQPQNVKNADIFGYGSGYGILPSIEGGVGVSCYPRIFETVGYKFTTVASGKTFDVYQISKK